MPDPSPVPPRLVLGAALLAGGLLLAAGPAPQEAIATLGGDTDDPYGPLLALLVLPAQALVAWLLLTTALTAGAHLPGRCGRALTAVARRAAPVAVRRGLEVALGLGVVTSTLGAAPALATTTEVAGSDTLPVSLDWGAPAVPEPEAEAAAPVREPVPAAVPPAVPAVVVQPGDSLWRLAERDLAARGVQPTDAAVARAWPTWWAANRDAVGEDPDLLLPGTPLERPADAP